MGRRPQARRRRTSPASCAKDKAPEEVPELPLPDGDPVHLPAVLAAAFGLSTSEARRLIGDGAVKADGEVVRELDLPRARVSKMRLFKPGSAASSA